MDLIAAAEEGSEEFDPAAPELATDPDELDPYRDPMYPLYFRASIATEFI